MTSSETITELLGNLPEVQVHQVISDSGDQYSVLLRTLDAQSWTKAVGEMLKVEEELGDDCPFKLHLCRQYIRYEGQLRYMYHLTVQATEDMDEALDVLGELLRVLAQERPQDGPPTRPSSPVSKKEADSQASAPSQNSQNSQKAHPAVQVVPLVAAGSQRNQPRAGLWKSGSKGAHLIRGPQ